MNNKITIVIWVHNRLKNLDNLLNYLNNGNYDIIISDSSENKNFDYTKYERIINILYYDHKINYYHKIVDTLSHVETEYFCWQNDDDITLIEALDESNVFLQDNKGYSLVTGYLCHLAAPGFYDKSYRFWSQHDQENSTPLERLKDMFNCFCGIHGVSSVKFILDITKIVGDNKIFHPIRFYEKILALSLSLNGKIKILPIVYEIRSKYRMIDQDASYPAYLHKNTPFNNILPHIKDCNPLSEYMGNILEKSCDECTLILRKIFQTFIKSNNIIKINNNIKLPITNKYWNSLVKPLIKNR